MTAADGRHLRRMLDCIAGMRSESVSLVQGADSLLFLRNALEHAEQSWVDELTSHLATLEFAGLASPEQVTAMGSKYAEVVAGALDALEDLVRGRFPDGVPPAGDADSKL